MIPDYFYMTELGKWAYGAVYLPVVIIVFLLLWKKIQLSWKVLVPIALMLLSLPFWDVYMIGRDADRLCKEQGGLHVYKTVEADGFRGSINNWYKFGFSFIEDFGIGPEHYNKKYRYRMVNGEEMAEEIKAYTTRYGIKGKKYDVISKSFGKNSVGVEDLLTGEVLGELTILNIHPGLFDGVLLRLVGSGPVVWHCGDEPPEGRKEKLTFQDVVIATLKPKSIKDNVR